MPVGWCLSASVCLASSIHWGLGRISLHRLPFPVGISATLFLGHVKLSLDSLLGGASACDPSCGHLFLRLPSSSSGCPVHTSCLPTVAVCGQSCPLPALESIHCSFYISIQLSNSTASFTWTTLSVGYLRWDHSSEWRFAWNDPTFHFFFNWWPGV